jgi:hypothetical protein
LEKLAIVLRCIILSHSILIGLTDDGKQDMNAKQEIITFKADVELVAAMRGVENRSEFIRKAILDALDNTCPLCSGAGTLTPQQKRHWEYFSSTHALAECTECHAMHLTCKSNSDRHAHHDLSDKKGTSDDFDNNA